jgi:hypothetical protein
MSGASALTGQANAVNTVLKDCLVTGFNVKPVQSLTQSGGVARALFASAHGFVAGDIVLLSGANESAYNGEAKVLASSTSTALDLAVDSGAPATATGTISCKRAPCGWSAPFVSGNVSVFLPPVANAQYLRIDHSGALVAAQGARNAYVRGYASMTDAVTGIGPYPTVAQFANGLNMRVSETADATARPWVLAANDHFIVLAVARNLTSLAATSPFAIYYWGKLDNTTVPNDFSAWIIGACYTDAPASICADLPTAQEAPIFYATFDYQIARCGYLQSRLGQTNSPRAAFLSAGLDNSERYTIGGNQNQIFYGVMGGRGFPFFAASGAALLYTVPTIFDADSPRGDMPIIRNPRHANILSNLDENPGPNGRRFVALRVAGAFVGSNPSSYAPIRGGDDYGCILLEVD